MMYEKFVRDFADRTRTNLNIIEKNEPDLKITQLINSCLGLIAFPRQICFDNIPETPLEELASKGWSIPRDEGGYPPARNLNELVQRLRNGIMHGHLQFSPDNKYQIESLLVWDTKFRTDKKIWQARFNMNELWNLVIKFSDKLIDGSFCSGCGRCPY